MITKILLVALFTAFYVSLQGSSYQVILLKGKVAYKGTELTKGMIIECGNLADAETMAVEMINFTFSAGNDEVRLLDMALRKIIIVSARTKSEGRDLMLATRGSKLIKSDFEFKRAFNPSPSPLVMIAEDTIICTGLENYDFKGNIVLIAQYMFDNDLYEKVIGQNDTIFLTKQRLFSSINKKKMYSSFETGEISLFFRDIEAEEDIILPKEFKPFALYFLDDIISYYASVEYDGIKLTADEIAGTMVPAYLKLRQIQREYGFQTENEARIWLVNHITEITAKHDLK